MPAAVIDHIRPLPVPMDLAAVARAWGEPGAEILKPLAAAKPLLNAVFGGSPYLREIILRDPGFAVAALTRSPSELLNELMREIAGEIGPGIAALMRRNKTKAALLIALADLS